MDEVTRGSGSSSRRWWWRGVVGVIAFLAIFHLVGGWYFSGRIDSGGLRPSAPERNYGVEIVSYDDEQVILAGEDAAISDPGTYALVWDDGHATVGGILAESDDGVTRSLLGDPGDPPMSPSEVDLDAWMFSTPSDAGLDYSDVSYTSPVGDMEAWLVPASVPSTTWAIHVHGWRADRREVIRSLGAFHRADVTSLVISYRNDPGAPPDPTGRYRFGQSEWADLEGAVRYALDNGAQDIVLSGFSTGGAVALAFMNESDLADDVTAIVLDSPNLDFGHVVKTEASRTDLVPGLPVKVPGSLTAAAMAIAELRYGVDWDAIDYVEAGAVDVPVLILHGTDDTTVPLSISQRFEAANPDSVTMIATEGAAHVRSWNVDPDRYEAALIEFLAGN
jgi:fermentation-respiration switch protein FrsA (DUF1100 family)